MVFVGHFCHVVVFFAGYVLLQMLQKNKPDQISVLNTAKMKIRIRRDDEQDELLGI